MQQPNLRLSLLTYNYNLKTVLALLLNNQIMKSCKTKNFSSALLQKFK